MSQYRSAGALGCHTRIRAGFPREHPVDRSMARDRPSPYAEGKAFAGFPRERPVNRSMARDRFSHRPTRKGKRFFHRSVGHVTATLNYL